MPNASPMQGSFVGGEFSKLLGGRVEAERYKTGLDRCLNYLPMVEGGLMRRPGTKFVTFSSEEVSPPRLMDFEYSTTQAYILEFGTEYIRFYKDNALITLTAKTITAIAVIGTAVQVTSAAHGFTDGDRIVITGVSGMTQVNNLEFVVSSAATNTFVLSGVNGSTFDAYTSGGSAAEIYEVVSPYGIDEVFHVKYDQSADVLYLAHPTYAPRKLSRTGHTSWTMTVIPFIDGPYLPTNQTSTTLTPSGFTGSVTLTASSVAGINNGDGFKTTDVGRIIRIKQGTVWGWGTITAWTSTTVVTFAVNPGSTLTDTSAKATWRLGVYSETTGYPSCVVFHEERLGFAGCPGSPQRFDLSRSGDYENFAPSDADGTITSSHAVGAAINASDVNNIRWMTSDEKGMLVGTVGGEWTIKGAGQQEPITPTSINAKRSTKHGSADIQPVQVGKSTLFIQRAGKKLRELAFFYDVDGYQASNLTALSGHITGEGGVTQLSFQQEPQAFVWMPRADGVLVGMNYERDIDSFKVGCSRHILGGYGDQYRNEAKVRSSAVIPSADGLRDEQWLVVERYINGTKRFCVEYATQLFDDNVSQKDAFFVDCGATFDARQSGSVVFGATTTVTVTGHGYSTGDRVYVRDGSQPVLEDQSYYITVLNANTFTLDDLNTATEAAIFPSGSAYFSKYVTSVSGLNFLEGATVKLLADGSVHAPKVVTNGKIALDRAAAVLQIGFGYVSQGQQLRLDAGSATGTSIGKTRRAHRVGFLLHRTLGFKYGTSFDEMTELTFRNDEDGFSSATPLFSGIVSEQIEGGYDMENQVCWEQDDPLPGTILAVMPQMVTQDRG